MLTKECFYLHLGIQRRTFPNPAGNPYFSWNNRQERIPNGIFLAYLFTEFTECKKKKQEWMVNENDGKTRCTCRFARANYYARALLCTWSALHFFFSLQLKKISIPWKYENCHIIYNKRPRVSKKGNIFNFSSDHKDRNNVCCFKPKNSIPPRFLN